MATDRSVTRHIFLVSIILGGMVSYVAWRMGKTRPGDETSPAIPENGLATATEIMEEINIPPLPGESTSQNTQEVSEDTPPPPSMQDAWMPPLPGEQAPALLGTDTPHETLVTGEELATAEEDAADIATQDTLPPPSRLSVPLPSREPSIRIEPANAPSAIHTVHAGDTLSGISFQYYGTSRRWREIHEANRATLPNPAALAVGMQLRIPSAPMYETTAPRKPGPLTPPATAESVVHHVQEGETLFSIAAKYHLRATADTIATIRNPDGSALPAATTIKAGMTLLVYLAPSATTNPHPLEYTIQRGDTLSGIARMMYGSATAWRRLYEANPQRIPNPNRLTVGITIRIPPQKDTPQP